MRMWVGPEKEGYEKGVMTLFVAEYEPSLAVVKQVATWAEQHHQIKRIYFGAGRIDAHFDTEAFISFIQWSINNGLKVVLEVSSLGVIHYSEEFRDEVSLVIRMDIPQVILTSYDYIKIDTHKKVYIIDPIHTVYTSLDTLQDNLQFTGDEEVYNSEAPPTPTKKKVPPTANTEVKTELVKNCGKCAFCDHCKLTWVCIRFSEFIPKEENKV